MERGHLVLSVKKGEKVFIGHNITFEIAGSARIPETQHIRIAICAPRHVTVLREELYKAKYDG